MRGWLALLCAAALGLASVSIDPCKRQPFRGRCPSINGESPKRSQFVLRYYMRNSECVSYPFGHCVNDSNEPKLYRYKEECEDACINAAPGNLKSDRDQTYATLSPDQKEEQQKIAKMAFLDPNLIPQPEKPKIIESHPPAIEPTTTEASTTEAPSTTVKSTETPSTSTSTRKSTTTVQEKTTHEPRKIIPSGTTKTPRTECESRRAAASSASIKGGFIPTCNANGGFEKIQCEPDGRQCFCVNEKGIEIPNSRTSNAQKPDCEKIQSASNIPVTKECAGSPSRGPCQSRMTHWYYDEIEQKCKKFTYSGCGGNGNNYETQMACESRCAPPPIGLARCEKGEPLKTSIGVPVNCAKERCPPDYKCSVVQQSSVCCPDTVKTPVGEQTFVNANVCQLPKDRGPCDKYELRFFYNSELKECKYFFWGGCGGNGNNFESANVCEETCIGGTNFGQDQSSEEFENLNAAGRTTQRPITIRTTQGIRITPNGPGNATEASNRHPTTTRRTTTARTNPTTTRRTTTTRHTTRPTTRRTITPSPRTLPTRAKTTTTPIWKGDEEYEDGDSFGPEEGSDERQSPPAEPLPLPAIPDAILLEVNRCLHPKDPGPCKGSFVRWYWNADKKFCDVFTYNGCGGNGNNFASREECLAICHKEIAPVVVPDFSSVCNNDVDAGECNGVFQRFAFDTETGECRPFTYGGCGGNGNNFATMAECSNRCERDAETAGNPCDADIEAGECSGVFARFGYDKGFNDCRHFTYGGCGGNGNNFATIQECRKTCVRKSCPPTPQCDLARCQLVNDRNGCPFCSCPPVKQPAAPGSNASSTQQPIAYKSVELIPTRLAESTTAKSSAEQQSTTTTTSMPFEMSTAHIFMMKTTTAKPRGSNCPSMNAADCEDPCIIITNRLGCQECKCPAESFGPEPPLSQIPERITGSRVTTTRAPVRAPPASHQTARPPASHSNAGPPAAPSTSRPQAPGTNARANSAKTIPGIDKNSISLSSLPENTSTNIKEKCLQPVDPGPCNHYIERWYFNTANGHCQPFNYGGCAGNHNHFFTQKECEIHCARFIKSIGRDESRPEEHRHQQFVTQPRQRQTLPPVRETTQTPLRAKSPIVAGTRTRIIESVAPPKPVQSVQTRPSPPPAITTTPRPNTPSQTKPTLPPTPSTSNEPSTETTTSEFITTTEAPTTEDPLRKAVFANNDFNSDYVDPAFAHLQDITQIEDKYPREKVLKETVEVQRMQEADLKMDTGADQASLKRIEISPRGQLLHQHEQREHVVASPAHDSPTTSVDAPDEPLVAGDELPPQITGTDSEFAPPPAPVMITSKGMLHDEDEAMADLSDWSLEQQNGDVAPPGGFPEVNAAGKSIFEPDDTQPDPAELATAGREPVPRGPTGIAKAPQPELTDLEKSTTEAPSSVEVHPAPAPSTEKTPAFDAAVACNQPPDAGGCTNYVPRWFYNPQSGQCEQFSYGSCGGNLNNFADRSICESQCLKLKNFPPLPTRCTLHKDSGFGKGYHVKWYFNMKNLRCEQFVYEGDGGNENRFERLTDCEAICTAPKSGYRKTTVAESQLSTQPSTEQPITAKPKSPVEDYETEEKEDDIDLNEFFSSAIGTDKNILSEMAKSANKQGSSNEALPPAPAAQAAKTVGEEEIKAANAQEASKKEYKAEPVSSKLQPLGESGNFASSANANQPVVAPSPPVEIDYTLGGRKVQPSRKAHGLPNFGGADPIDFTEGKPNLERMPACPNGRIELKYPDGRSVNCLPGKNQCPDRSVCFFNGVDFFCCPNDDDPYDKHVFGGYDGEEAKHGYKVFGKLNIRRLMDEIPLRARRRRQTNRFDMDGAVAPMRFDSQNRPYTVSRAMRMKPKPPTRGNPMCIEPVVIGSCNEAHLRYFYDRATDTCRLFHYSGCDGNGNNFGSQSDCERLCVLNFEGIQDRMAQEVEQANQESITTTTHKPAPPGKCPDDATPLGGSSPVLCGNSTESIACPEGYFCSGGPPDICCPITEQQQKEVEQHFSPHGFVASQSNLPRGFSRHTFLAPPKFMCPDASDPMVDQTGQPVPCGAGFDGMKLCPRGYYCAIDSEKNSRLCCPLFGQASRIPAEEMTAPYYKKQKTPEVRERKRMPANPVIEEIKEVVESIGQQRQISPAELPASPQEEELGDDEFEDYQDEPGEFKHLKLKAEEPVERNKTTPTPKSDEEVSIDMGDSSQESPNLNEESISQAPKPKQSQQKDKSVCQLKPSEGRACREDEKAPRTNLHYFYSPTAKKCKLYFYKGCGGNDNRFEKKVDCEALCSEIRL